MDLQQFDFRFAYTFCAEVQDVVFKRHDSEPEWFLPDDETFVAHAAVPNQRTLLHDFIYEIVSFGVDYDTGHGDPEGLIEDYGGLLNAAGIKRPRWFTPSGVGKRISELDVLLREAVRQLAPAAFHVLFADLRFLHAFQEVVATRIRQFKAANYPEYLRADGVLARPVRWPKWLQRGVFFRDKGLCQSCQRDLTGTLNRTGKVHLDHILPLARGGSNDPTNLQILCHECNMRKGPRIVEGTWHTQTYW